MKSYAVSKYSLFGSFEIKEEAFRGQK